MKVLQTEDDTIETGLRLAQAKFGKKLTVRGSDAFKASVARVAAEKGLWVEFTDQHLNQLMAARKAELQQAREKMAVPPPAPITPTVKPPSVLSSLEPNTDRGLYTGQVVGIDKRYVYQAHGKDIIRHDRNLFSTVPAQGEKIRISYKGGQMKAELRVRITPGREDDSDHFTTHQCRTESFFHTIKAALSVVLL